MNPLVAQPERLRDITHGWPGRVEPPHCLMEFLTPLLGLGLHFAQAITRSHRVPDQRLVGIHSVV